MEVGNNIRKDSFTVKNSKRVVFLHISDYKFPIPRVHVIAEALAQAGYDVHVVCLRQDSPKKEIINHVTVWNVETQQTKRNVWNVIKSLPRMEKIVLDLNPDVIQVFSPLLLPLGAILKQKLGCKLVYDCYEPWIHGSIADKKLHSAALFWVIHIVFSKYVDGALFVYMKNPIINYFKRTKKLWFPNVLKEEYIKSAINKSCKKKTDNKGGLFLIGYLGTVTRYKGHITAVEAMRYLDSSYRLYILGAIISKEVEDKMRKLIDEHNLLDRVIITGKIEDFSEILAYAREMDVGLMIAEDTEWQRYTLPAKLFDYMALGLPIIVSDLPNFREFLEKNKCGIAFVNPKNSVELAQTIRTLRSQLTLLKKISIRCRKQFLKNYQEKILINRFLKFYNNILQNM